MGKPQTRYCLLCKNKQGGIGKNYKNNNVKFHKFTTNSDSISFWFEACNLNPEVDFVANVFICSDHFDDENDYVSSIYGKKLKKGAVPTINIPNKNFAKKYNIYTDSGLLFATPQCKIEETDDFTQFTTCFVQEYDEVDLDEPPKTVEINIQPIIDDHNYTKLYNIGQHPFPRHPHQLTAASFETPFHRKLALDLVLSTVGNLHKQVKILKQRNRNLNKKVKCMQEMLNKNNIN